MNDIVEKLNRTHTIGINCQSVCMRDIMGYYGITMTEAVYTGLSGTVSYALTKPHSHFVHLPYLSMFGSVGYIFDSLASKLGLEYEYFENMDFDDCLECMKYFLQRGIPVITRVAPYVYKSVVDSLAQSKSNSVMSEYARNFAGLHFIVIAEIDVNAGMITFFDSYYLSSCTIPIDLMKEAMNSQNIMAAINQMIIIYPFEKIQITPLIIYDSVSTMVSGMETESDYLGESVNGFKAFEQFRKIFFELPKKYDAKTVKTHLAFQYYAGGGMIASDGFSRRAVGKFLNYASSITNDERFAEAAKTYMSIATQWYSFFKVLMKYITNADDAIFSKESIFLVDNIYEKEKKGIALLKNVLRYE